MTCGAGIVRPMRRSEGAVRVAGPYRVEHQDANGQVDGTLGRLPAYAPAHHATLAPFVAHLRLAGRDRGVLALVDEATSEVVARRLLGGSTNPRARTPGRSR